MRQSRAPAKVRARNRETAQRNRAVLEAEGPLVSTDPDRRGACGRANEHSGRPGRTSDTGVSSHDAGTGFRIVPCEHGGPLEPRPAINPKAAGGELRDTQFALCLPLPPS